jgi:energy-coupling factor transporter ATP-binding protein EcfA2
MKRTFATTTIALSLLGLSACKGGAGDAIKYVPDGASVIGGVDLAALQKSALWEKNKDKIESGQNKEMMEAAKACNLGQETWKSVVFGADVSNAEGKMVVVLGVDGVGKKENLECIAGKIKEKTEKDPWTLEEKDGKLTLNMDGGKATGWAVGDNMLVVAGKDWAGSVTELIDGKGKAAVDGSLKDVVGRANTKEHIWVAGNIPSDMAQGPAAGAKDGTLGMNFADGLGLQLDVGFGSADDAKSKAAELNQQFEGMKGMAGEMVPKTTLDSVKIEAKDTAVHVEAKASKEDIDKISEALGKMIPGM